MAAELPNRPDLLVEDDGADVSALDIGTWLGEGKHLVASITVGVTVLAVALAFLLPVRYASTTVLLAPTPPQSAAAGALAALAATGVVGSQLGGKQPDELYVALLRSDTVLRALDERFKLQDRYDVSSFVKLRKETLRYTTIAADKKTGLIVVEVEDHDPKFATDLANSYASEVQKLMGRLAVSEAQLRRLFFEKQLASTKENLAQAERVLREVQERSGVIVLDKQAEALIGGAAQIRAFIAEREVQLKVLRASATEQNPDVQRLSSEVRALRGELARMESSQGAAGSAVDMPVGKLPEASIEYIRARRELRLQETLLEGMIRQFELARLDEAKEGNLLQVVEKAVPSDFRARPPRAIIIGAGVVLGLLAGVGWVVGRGMIARNRSDPRSEQAWSSLRRAWRFGR